MSTLYNLAGISSTIHLLLNPQSIPICRLSQKDGAFFIAALLYEHLQLVPWDSFLKVELLSQGVESLNKYGQMAFRKFMQIYMPTRSIREPYIPISLST